MKLPRWLVIVMLTTGALSVLAAAGWWWVTWPERTAPGFEDLIPAESGRGSRRQMVTVITIVIANHHCYDIEQD